MIQTIITNFTAPEANDYSIDYYNLNIIHDLMKTSF